MAGSLIDIRCSVLPKRRLSPASGAAVGRADQPAGFDLSTDAKSGLDGNFLRRMEGAARTPNDILKMLHEEIDRAQAMAIV